MRITAGRGECDTHRDPSIVAHVRQRGAMDFSSAVSHASRQHAPRAIPTPADEGP